MNGGDIRFVHLGITINHLKSSISVFGFRIAFYGIIIGIGMLAGLWIAQSDAKRRGQDPELYLDFALYAIICSIIGARLYYVIFEWDYYKNNLLQIFNLRAGGLAIYGGVIAGTITMIVYTRMKKVSFFSMADTGVLGLVTGQIIGRWGNFFNCEAFGGYTDSLLAMRIRRALVNDDIQDCCLYKLSFHDRCYLPFFTSPAEICAFYSLCCGFADIKSMMDRCSGFICLVMG